MLQDDEKRRGWFIYQVVLFVAVGSALGLALGVPSQVKNWFGGLKQVIVEDEGLCNLPPSSDP